MYPKEFFIEQFASLSTEELLLKLSAHEMVDNARAAATDILVQRGISAKQSDELGREAHKAVYRRSNGTSRCDYCNNSAKNNPTLDGGQRFCSANCLQAARVNEAAVDLTKAEIEQAAVKIRSGPCPICGQTATPVEVRSFHRVASFVVLTNYTRTSKICCLECAKKGSWEAFFSTLVMGWWGIPFGIFMTPAYLIANIGEMFEHRKMGEPSDDLLREAKYQLAVAAKNRAAF